MRKIILLFALLPGIFAAHARDIIIKGEVKDAMFQEALNKAVVRVLTPDGTLLATDTTSWQLEYQGGGLFKVDKTLGAKFSVVVSAEGPVVLQVEAKGFMIHNKTYNLDEIKKNRLDVGIISLLPQPKDRQLAETEVKGTKIKMYYKGDTLVYNAEAFDVEQNETLRNLIRKLPGVEMKGNRIYVNGKPIDNLLLSGKDFFQGNIKAALDNLPAFVVSKINVYDKAGELSELTGKDMHDESYVMDVRLKRQYNGVWLVQFSADLGTRDLYGAEAYVMRMDEHQMFSLNAEINNLNLNREMTDFYSDSKLFPDGRMRTKYLNMNYYIDPNNTWHFDAHAHLRQNDADKNAWRNVETFLSPANLMERSAWHDDTEQTMAELGFSLRERKSKSHSVKLNYQFNFNRTISSLDSRSISYFMPGRESWGDSPIDSIRKWEESLAEENRLVNSLLNPMRSRTYELVHRPKLETTIVLGDANTLTLEVPLSHSNITQNSYSNYRLFAYHDDALSEQQRLYRYRRDYMLHVSPRLEFRRSYDKANRYSGVLKPYAAFDYSYGTGRHPQYRLERMEEWSAQTGWSFDNLGSTPDTEWRQHCLDEINSFFSRQRNNTSDLGLQWRHEINFGHKDKLTLQVDEAASLLDRKLDYSRDSRDYRVDRNAVFGKHSASVAWERNADKWKPNASISYNGSQAMPELTRMLPIVDNADPLNIALGNPHLRNSFTHEARVSYGVRHVKSKRSFNTGLSYRRLFNDMAMSSEFDPATGIRATRPVNTDHTYSLGGKLQAYSPIDKKATWTIFTGVDGDYYRCQNLSYLNGAAGTQERGMLRDLALKPWLSLTGGITKYVTIMGGWRSAFHHVTQPGFKSDYSENMVSGMLSVSLPFELNFRTSIQHRFFSGNSLNSLDNSLTAWNASISRKFLSDLLEVTLTVNDILAQAHSFNSSIDAVCRTESYADVLPRHILLHVYYRLPWTGKKKKDAE